MKYYYSTDGKEVAGPHSDAQMRYYLEQGVLPPTTLVCVEGLETWQTLSSVFLKASAESVPPQLPQTTTGGTQSPPPLPETAPVQAASAATGNKQMVGLIGSALMFLGVFCPFVSVPIIGHLNYFQNGRGDGAIVLLFALGSAALACTRRFTLLWFTGGGTLGVLALTYLNLGATLEDLRSQMQTDLRGNPFARLGEMAVQSVQMQWGVAVVVLGAVLVIASAAMPANRTNA